MARENPKKHHKTLFILSAIYSMYLRISELTATSRWTPKMCDFYRNQDGLWWFNVIGKGNKHRQIAVSDPMLKALRVYRKSLNLSPLPLPSDNSLLIPKTLGTGPIRSTNHLRKIVQVCFDRAVERLKKINFTTTQTLFLKLPYIGYAISVFLMMRAIAQVLSQTNISTLNYVNVIDQLKRNLSRVKNDTIHDSL